MKQTLIFCAACGKPSLEVVDKLCFCRECGFQLYLNVAGAVGAFIEYEGKVLITTRTHEPAAGCVDLPGGFVDRFETAEEALIREIREELNLQISDLQYIGSASNRYPYKEIEYHTIDLFFVCSVANIDGIVAMDDITAFRWVAPDDLDSESFPFDSIREGVRLYLNWKQK